MFINILSFLKQKKQNNPFKFFATVLTKIFPYAILKNVTYGKSVVTLLLPITFNKSFRTAFLAIRNEVLKYIPRTTFTTRFANELFKTYDLKSKGYHAKLLHVKQLKKVLQQFRFRF